jgi:hypothetical protein
VQNHANLEVDRLKHLHCHERAIRGRSRVFDDDMHADARFSRGEVAVDVSIRYLSTCMLFIRETGGRFF